jgi:membrane-bound lytic murein transglycosylase D
MRSGTTTLFIVLFFISGCAHSLQDAANPTPADIDAAPSMPSTEPAEPLMAEINPATDLIISHFPPLPAYTPPPLDDGIPMAVPPVIEDADDPMDDTEIAANAPDPEPPANTQTAIDEALEHCRISQDLWQQGELENALEALDTAYALILQVDTENQPKLMQQIDDLRFMISKRILEIYASRNIVVNGQHNAIPIVMNQYVRKEIKLLTESNRSFFIEAYKRSGRYRPMIEAALVEAGLPKSLSWLPLIESGYRCNALSHARALGLWQFIPSTGYKFGLKRNRYIDERLDPVKSTEAAISYLKELHKIFGDWATVLAAYNCGEGRVLQVIRNQNINYLDNFWDLYERLPRETARYVPRFLATLHIVENLDKFGLAGISPHPPSSYETVTISRQVHLKAIAQAVDIPLETLKALNPELRYGIVPPAADYALRVLPDMGKTVLARIDALPTSTSPQAASYVYHRVRGGDTLSTIARKYGTSVSKITKANRISERTIIVPGQRLRIPCRNCNTRTATSRPARSSSTIVKHRVHSGDSLWIIARKYDTSTKAIQRANGMKGTRIAIGQVLKIPTTRADRSGSYRTYQVKRGDIPFEIARRYNMPLQRFLKVNRLTESSKIYPGQKLYVE